MSYKWLTQSKRKRKYIFSKFKDLRWDFRIKRACGLLFNGGPCSEIVLFPFTIPGFFSKNILWGPNGSQHSVFGWWDCTFPNPTLLLKKKYRKYIAINRNGGVLQCSKPLETCLLFSFIPWLKAKQSKPKEGKETQQAAARLLPNLYPWVSLCFYIIYLFIITNVFKSATMLQNTHCYGQWSLFFLIQWGSVHICFHPQSLVSQCLPYISCLFPAALSSSMSLLPLLLQCFPVPLPLSLLRI